MLVELAKRRLEAPGHVVERVLEPADGEQGDARCGALGVGVS
jgi:hypothetical protein